MDPTQKLKMLELLQAALERTGADTTTAEILTAAIAMSAVLLISLLANYLAKNLIVALVKKLVQKTSTQWDDQFLRWKVFQKLSHLAPALVIYSLAPYALHGYPGWTAFFVGASKLYMILVGVLILDAALNALHDIYHTYDVSAKFPIKSFVQVLKIILYFLAAILAISTLIGKSPNILLGGLGALTAILMLVFKDPILGFVAGIQLTSNKMVAVGDWIQMPKHGADGGVIEVALTTVKVQNWDKTITTIPTYALISDSFKNWRGMSESGGRRIKRAVCIDMNTIRFCTEEMLQRFARIDYIADYIETKKQELARYNASRKIDLAMLANGRRLTNIGTLRAYISAYLRDHPMVNQEMTFLVRHLAPTEHGLPLEIYVFCKDKVWANYEAVQADIFDHILAVVPEFDLRVFQDPAGSDFRRLMSA